jgi:hypothetical protein
MLPNKENCRPMPTLPLRRPVRLAACLAVLAILSLSSAPMAAARHPLSPSQARSEITTYFNRIYFDLVSDPGDMSIQTETVTPGRMVITGACAPGSLDILRVDDSEANGQTIVQCQTKNGRHLQSHIARDRMPYISQQHVTYEPLLTRLGERAATSVGVPSSEHGTATTAFDSKTDLDITYARDPADTGRQLKQLRIHVGHIREAWYR